MDHSYGQSRRGFTTALLGGLSLMWLVTGKSRTETPAFDVPQLNLQKAKELIDAGAVVLDVRGDSQFEHRHIPVAVLVPLEVLRTSIPTWLSELKAKQIVVYSGDGVRHGPEATHILQQAGFAGAANLTVGIEGWDSAGLPVQRG